MDLKTVGIISNLNLLEQFGEMTYYQMTLPEQISERIKDAEIVITKKVVFDKKTIEKAQNLKLIYVSASGTNIVDKEAAWKKGILVKNAIDYSSNSDGQGTFSLLLHLLCNIPYYAAYVKDGRYSRSDIFNNFGEPFWELSGKRFGIIGLGNISRKVTKIAGALGMEVVYYSASVQKIQQKYLKLDLEDFLSSSDVISIHAPLNKFTAGLLNYRRLKLMKKTAILINALAVSAFALTISI